MVSSQTLLLKIHKKLMSGDIELPAIPAICLKIRKASADPESDITTIATIAQADAAFCGYIINLANSPLFRGVSSITNVQQAIGRMGMQSVRRIAMTFATRSLFKMSDDNIKKWVANIWTRSLHTATLSHVIASHTKIIDADDALVAGLMQDIGALPLLMEISKDEQILSDRVLVNKILNKYVDVMSSALMQNWNMGDDFKMVAETREDWHREHNGPADLSDIVLLAKYHMYIGTSYFSKLPKIIDLPVFEKIPTVELTPNMSFQFLDEAKEEIKLIKHSIAS